MLTPVYNNKNFFEPQMNLLLNENNHCLITKLHCVINYNSHIKHVCRRCRTAFNSIDNLYQHIEKCIKQQPTKISFSWKDQLTFGDNHMQIPLPIRVYVDFKGFIQPQNNPKVILKQNPIAIRYYLISPFGNYSFSYFGEVCVSWFVKDMLTLQKMYRNILKQKYHCKYFLKRKYSSNNTVSQYAGVVKIHLVMIQHEITII